MANTTSGTHTFDKTFSIDQIIEEAFERLGIQNVTGYQLKSSRRSLNIMLQEWGNRGIHYWEIAETNIDLIEGQSETNFLDRLMMVQVQQLLQLTASMECPMSLKHN